MPEGKTEAEPGGSFGGAAFTGCADSCMILTETDHRVANHLAMLSSYIRLKERAFDGNGSVPRNAVTLFARGIDAQIRSVARLHRHLMTHRGQDSPGLAAILGEVCRSYASSVPNCTIVTRLDAGCVIGAEQLLPVAQLVNEAVTNAIKYAFVDQRPGEVLVSCSPSVAGGVVVEISDNGVGLPESFDPDLAGGFGVSLMRTLSQRLGGALTFHSGPAGLTVRLSLPPAFSGSHAGGSGRRPRSPDTVPQARTPTDKDDEPAPAR